MAKVVRDASGLAWELVAAGAAAGRGARGVDVTSVTIEREHEAAMRAALIEIGRLPDRGEPPRFDTIRALVEQALQDGTLKLERVDTPRPAGDIVDVNPPEPLVPDDDDDVVKESHTLEIELVNPWGKPVGGAAFKVKLPGGEIRKGNLNNEGKAVLDKIESSGDCEVTFTAFDQDAWGAA